MKALSKSSSSTGSSVDSKPAAKFSGGPRVRRNIITASILVGAVACMLTLWLASRAVALKSELETSVGLVVGLRSNLEKNDLSSAEATVNDLKTHTTAAREISSDPLWTAAHALPWLGPNFLAASEVATSADDLAHYAADPVVQALRLIDLKAITPINGVVDTAPLQAARPKLASASYAVGQTTDRLNGLNADHLLPQLAVPLAEARDVLESMRDGLDAAADAANIVPGMLGARESRDYLLMIQNNAEARASGGIPGALAILSLDRGKVTLGAQSTAGKIGVMSPIVPVDREQQQIYSTRVGKFMQDVNLTPDFPTAAASAKAMWEKKTGQRVDGVISIDPVVLSYILQSTGPVAIVGPELAEVKAAGLPTELTGSNVVPTLLSDVYAKIQQPELQDAYFAGVAKEVFSALSSGKGEAKGLVAGITRGAEEKRVLLWSTDAAEQSIIAKYPLSGSVTGPSVAPAQFGVYFNDGTGAKMDYYVKRTVQLLKECSNDGYGQITVRITSTNTAPANAATSLPEYVTGAGVFGVPPGSVQTNVAAYGPVQANIESAKLDGQRTEFAPYVHANRPVGVVAQRLAPGESKTLDFTFGKIVQHTEPNVFVTPTVQPVKDVTLPVESATCDQGQRPVR